MGILDLRPFLIEAANRKFNLVQLQNLIYSKSGYRIALSRLQQEITRRAKTKLPSYYSAFPSLRGHLKKTCERGRAPKETVSVVILEGADLQKCPKLDKAELRIEYDGISYEIPDAEEVPALKHLLETLGELNEYQI